MRRSLSNHSCGYGFDSGHPALHPVGTSPASISGPEVRDFLRDLDLDLVRVLEDVIDLLVARGVFRFTDLPESAQQKLMFRKTLRSQWQAVPNPLGSDEKLF